MTQQPDLSTILNALSQQQARNSKRSYESFDALRERHGTKQQQLENQDWKNPTHAHCLHCSETIFSPQVGSLHYTREFSLPGDANMTSSLSDQTPETWWKVQSVMNFDNVAVSKQKPTTNDDKTQYPNASRFLTCAACEKDILGFVSHKGESYIACERVQYRGGDDSGEKKEA